MKENKIGVEFRHEHICFEASRRSLSVVRAVN